MSGWIEPLPSKHFRAVYHDETGERHSQTFADRKQAKAFLAAAVVDIARGQWIDPRGCQIPFAEWAARWSGDRQDRRAQAG